MARHSWRAAPSSGSRCSRASPRRSPLPKRTPRSSSSKSRARRSRRITRPRSGFTTTSTIRATSFSPENMPVTMPHDPVELHTPRLTLFAYTADQLLVLLEQPERFEEVAALTPAPELRGFYVSGDVSPKWLDLLRRSVGQGPNPWRHGFWIIEKESGQIIGGAGFKGEPDAGGMVEIAYGVVPSREGRGYATEAALALIHFASSDPRVRLVRAHTRPQANASTRVLTKCGFAHIGEVIDPEDGPVWRWELSAHHIGAR